MDKGHETFTAVYGGSCLTGRRDEPVRPESELLENLKTGNNFVGYHAFSPYVGIESYFGSIAVGQI